MWDGATILSVDGKTVTNSTTPWLFTVEKISMIFFLFIDHIVAPRLKSVELLQIDLSYFSCLISKKKKKKK